MKTLDEVRDAALNLPVSERVVLAEELLGSVPERPGVREEDLQAVLASRIAALESGEEELLDGPTAVAEIRSELRRRPKAS
jgi:putative addiction module component (TIGR02574 family)